MDRFLRLKQIIGDKKADPPIPAIIPISKTEVYRRIAEGTFPPPQKFGVRTSVWRESTVMSVVNGEWQPEDGYLE